MEASTFTEPGLVAVLGGLLLAVGGVGLLRRSDERVSGRVVAFLAMCAAFYAAFDVTEQAVRTEPADLQIVTTGSESAPWLAPRVGPRPGGGDVRAFSALDGQIAEAALAAALSSRVDEDVVLVWDGPVPADTRWLVRPFSKVFATRVPGPFEPGDVTLRVAGGSRAGRPLLLEFDLLPAARDRLPVDARLAFRLVGATGGEGPAGEIDGGALRAGAVTWTWPIAEEGRWTVAFELDGQGHRLAAEGEFQVGPATVPVAIVGRGGQAFAAALEAQAVAATVHDRLPPDLEGIEVVVAMEAVSADDAPRLLEHVDRGGGLVVIGGPAGGGALPLADDPLAAIVPLHRQPLPPSDAGVGTDGPGDVESDQVERQPSKPEPDAAPEPGPDRPATEPPEGDPRGAVEAEGSPIQEAEVERRQVALVLVVDRSSSMSTSVRGIATRMDFAKRAAFETALRLEPGDELGVLAFGVRAYEVLPLGPVPEEAIVQRELEALRAIDGQTILGGAVGRAFAWLRESKAAVRHAVILTDGDRLDAGDLTLAQSAARRMGEAGITVSVIQIADTAVGLVRDLNEIARQGRGVFLRETDGSAIPRLVFAEVRRVFGAAGRIVEGEGVAAGGGGPGSGGAATPEGKEPSAEPVPPEPEPAKPEPAKPEPAEPEPAQPEPVTERPEPLPVIVLEDGPLVGTVPDVGLPDLFGISPVVATERARVLLATLDGTPLLATAHAGLGRVVAWASDISGPWTAAWRDDPLFAARLAGFAAAVRPADDAVEAIAMPWRTVAFDPTTPRRDVWERLQSIQGGGLPGPVSELAPGPDRRVPFSRRRGLDLACGAVLGMIVLAFVERFRRGVPR